MQSRWVIVVPVLIVFAAGFASRLLMARTAQYVGHGDFAYYYTLAENIANGKGFQLEYIWHYLSNPETVIHPSNDYWLPLASIIISLSLIIFDDSLFAALLPSILFGLALAIPTYYFSRRYSDSVSAAFLSAGVVLFVPYLFAFSLLTDAPIYYALFASLSLLLMIKGLSNTKFFLLAGASAGLAHLTRQDGVLLLVTMLVTILFAPANRTEKLKYALLSCGVYLFVLSPLLISNFQTFGSPYLSGSTQTIYLTQYEDLYSYGNKLTLQSYLDWGLTNIVRAKFAAARANAKVLYHNFFGGTLLLFIIVGLVTLVIGKDRRRRLKMLFPPFLFLVLMFLFYTLLGTLHSPLSFLKSSLSLIPFFVVIAVDGIYRNIRSRNIAALVIFLMIISLMRDSSAFTRDFLNENTRIGENLAMLGEIVRKDARTQNQSEIIIMTRNPWEVYHSTKYKTVQVPNEELDIIFDVAQRYGANYLLLPARREALEGLYEGNVQDDRFEFAARVPSTDLKLFRILVES